MSTVKSSFQGMFSTDCQQNSVPIRLLSLRSMPIDSFGPQEKGFSQSALTVSHLVMHEYRKKINTDSSTTQRHLKSSETPLPIYVGLKLCTTVRSKTLINRLFHLGICVSYKRFLDICNLMETSLLEKYDLDKVFITNSLKLKLFTIIGKDNIDLNSSSTKLKQHFHGISMTTMQFPSESNPAVPQETSYNSGAVANTQKLKLPDEYICLKDIPFGCNSPLFAQV